MGTLFSAFNWYGFLIGFGMLLCIIIAYFMNKSRGYSGDIVFDIALICIPLAIVGARAYYIIFDVLKNGNAAEWTLKRIVGLEGGLSGLAIYGGLIGGVIGGIIVYNIYKKKPEKEKMSFVQMLDMAFCVIVLGQVIGRWGNFANQEAYGQLVTNPSLQWFPLAVKIGDEWYQATFFYESFCNAIIFAVLMVLYNGRRKSFDGFCFSVYCIGYGTARFFIEGLRSDSLYLGIFRVSQLVSLAILALGVGIIVRHLILAKRCGKRPFIFVEQDALDAQYYGYEKSVFGDPTKKDFFLVKKTKSEFSECFDDGVQRKNGTVVKNSLPNSTKDGEKLRKKEQSSCEETQNE